MKILQYFSFFLFIFAPFFLIFIKKESSRLSKEIQKISRDIEKNEGKIKILLTEIDFITRPKRIEKITKSIQKK